MNYKNTHEYKVVGQTIKKIRKELKNIDINVNINRYHVTERIFQRNLSIIDFVSVTNTFIKNKLCLILYYMHLDESVRPFRIFIKSNDIIVVLSRSDNKWNLNTVLDPKKHNLYDDEHSSSTYQITIKV